METKIFKNIRKIVVGDDFARSIKYVKGANYNIGNTQAKISDILQDEQDPRFFNLYIQDSKNECSVFWKSVKEHLVLEVESDVNFE